MLLTEIKSILLLPSSLETDFQLMTQIIFAWNCIIEIEGCLGLLAGTQILHPWAFEYGHWAEMKKVKTLIFIIKLPPSPNTNVTFQFYTVQLFLNHLYKNFRSWLMMDELLSAKAPSSHYPLRHSLLMIDLKCLPSGSSAQSTVLRDQKTWFGMKFPGQSHF